MLTISHKANILRKSGLEVPPLPAEDASVAEGQRWTQAIETLYVAYAAARAAKSLRDAEEIRQMNMLRRMSAQAHA